MFNMAIVNPGIRIEKVTRNGNQSSIKKKKKIEGELIKYENVKREIQFPITTGQDNCIVNFKNGSSIRAISLGIKGKGDGARGKMFATLHRNVFNKSRRIAGKSLR